MWNSIIKNLVVLTYNVIVYIYFKNLNQTSDTSFIPIVKEITNNDMPVVVIDATGSQKAINNALQYLAHGGRFVLIGLQKGDISFNHPEFHKREAALMSSRNATRGDFEFVISCIKNKTIEPLKFITHRVLFDELAVEFPSYLNPETGVIKAIVEMK